MKPRDRRLVFAAAAALAVALLALRACDSAPSAAEKKTMEQYTQDMQTVCFGRFVIDVPRQVKLGNGQVGYVFAGVQVDERPHTLEQFKLIVDRKISALQASLSYKGRPNLHSTDNIAPDVCVVNEYEDDLAEFFTPRAYVLRDDAMIVIEGASAHSPQEYNRDFKSKLIDLLPKLKALPQGEMPKEPGFCMVGAYIAGSNSEGENADIALSLKDHSDVSFGVRTQVIEKLQNEPMLLDRESSIVKQMGDLMTGVKTLRKRRFQVNGQEAQEWSVALSEERGVEFEFHAEVRGVPNRPDQPEMDITMSVGGDGPSGWKPASLSEGEAIALWDALISSIKLRPDSF